MNTKAFTAEGCRAFALFPTNNARRDGTDCPSSPPVPRRTYLQAGSALATLFLFCAPAAFAAEIGEVDTITVIGQGSTRQLQSIDGSKVDDIAPGSSPLNVIADLPSVTFQSSDPLGIDLWSQSFQMRGFASNQLGFTLDGIPLGSPGYGSFNGLNIISAISSENIRRVNVSQGAGSVGVPSANNLGGSVEFVSSDPADKFGGQIDQSYGSYNSLNSFIRLDSGVLNDSGSKFYVSYRRTSEDKWKGSGEQYIGQVNVKFVQPIGDSTVVTGFFDWDEEQAATYVDMSLDSLKKLGSKWDYYAPNYAGAYNAALGIFSPAVASTNAPYDAAYYDGPATSYNYLAGLTVDTNIGGLDWKSELYHHEKEFHAWWTNAYAPSPNGAPLSEQDSFISNKRSGIVSDLSESFGGHAVSTGVWFENNHVSTALKYYQEPLLGEGTPYDPIANSGTPYAIPYGLDYNTNTFQYHLEDSVNLTDDLKLQAGFRSLVVTAHSSVTYNDPTYTGLTAADRPSGGITASNGFLPQVSANWKVAPHNEIYADISKNMRGYDEGGYYSGTPWGVATQSAFNQVKASIHPEEDWVYELGYRLTTDKVTALLSLYHTDFSNRLQAIQVGSAVELTSLIANVGSVRVNGADLSLTVKPTDNISVTNNFSVNDSVFKNDLTTGGVTYDLTGKKVPNYPPFMYKGNLSYFIGPFTAQLDVTFMGRRYLSYTNDTSVPSYWLENLNFSYDLEKISAFSDAKLTFSIYNLSNKTYVANMGELGNPLSGDQATLQVGAPREFMVGLTTKF